MITDDDLRRALRADAATATADPDALLARVRTGVRRRRARHRVAGAGAAALAVAGIALGAPALADLAPAQPAVSQELPGHTPDQARAAFAEAGFDDDDAWQLVYLWQWGDVDAVTAVAGLHLLEGRALPIEPGQGAQEAAGGQTPLREALRAYDAAGYDAADTAALAQRWEEDPELVRVYVGQALMDGEGQLRLSP